MSPLHEEYEQAIPAKCLTGQSVRSPTRFDCIQFLEDLCASPPIFTLYEDDIQEIPTRCSTGQSVKSPVRIDNMQFIEDICAPPPISPVHEDNRQVIPAQCSTSNSDRSPTGIDVLQFFEDLCATPPFCPVQEEDSQLIPEKCFPEMFSLGPCMPSSSGNDDLLFKPPFSTLYYGIQRRIPVPDKSPQQPSANRHVEYFVTKKDPCNEKSLKYIFIRKELVNHRHDHFSINEREQPQLLT